MNANIVKDDFYLATVPDIVADPSAPDAFVENIIENKGMKFSNGILKDSRSRRLKEHEKVKRRDQDNRKEC